MLDLADPNDCALREHGRDIRTQCDRRGDGALGTS